MIKTRLISLTLVMAFATSSVATPTIKHERSYVTVVTDFLYENIVPIGLTAASIVFAYFYFRGNLAAAPMAGIIGHGAQHAQRPDLDELRARRVRYHAPNEGAGHADAGLSSSTTMPVELALTPQQKAERAREQEAEQRRIIEEVEREIAENRRQEQQRIEEENRKNLNYAVENFVNLADELFDAIERGDVEMIKNLRERIARHLFSPDVALLDGAIEEIAKLDQFWALLENPHSGWWLFNIFSRYQLVRILNVCNKIGREYAAHRLEILGSALKLPGSVISDEVMLREFLRDASKIAEKIIEIVKEMKILGIRGESPLKVNVATALELLLAIKVKIKDNDMVPEIRNALLDLA